MRRTRLPLAVILRVFAIPSPADATTRVRLVRDIVLGVKGSNVHYLVSVGDARFFAAHDSRHGLELWKSDGTRAA